MSYDSPGIADVWGLDEYGNPVGVSEGVGAAVGLLVSFAGKEVVQRFAPQSSTTTPGALSGWQINAEGVGLGAAAVVCGGLMLAEKTRRAGWIGLALAGLSSGPRWISDMITGYVSMPAAAAPPAAGIGAYMMQQLVPAQMAGAGLGAPLVQQFGPSLGAPNPALLTGLAPQLSGLTHQFGAAPEVVNYGSHFGQSALGR